MLCCSTFFAYMMPIKLTRVTKKCAAITPPQPNFKPCSTGSQGWDNEAQSGTCRTGVRTVRMQTVLVLSVLHLCFQTPLMKWALKRQEAVIMLEYGRRQVSRATELAKQNRRERRDKDKVGIIGKTQHWCMVGRVRAVRNKPSWILTALFPKHGE